MEPTTLTIRTYSIDALRERLDTLNKRLAKHRLPAATISKISATFTTREDASWRNAWAQLDLSADETTRSAHQTILQAVSAVQDLVYLVEVSVPTGLIQWNGHIVRGRIQRLDDGAGDIITRIGNHDRDLSVYRGKPFRCSHCGSRRARKSLWVFERLQDQVLITLGDNCAQEYFGVDVQALLNDAWAFFSPEEEDDWGFGGSHAPDTHLAHLIATFGTALIAFEGFRSRKRFEDDCTSNQASGLAYLVKDKGMRQVSDALTSSWQRYTREWWAATMPRWQEFTAIVDAARTWWEGENPQEDYLANCRAAIRSMNPRLSAFLVCAVWEFMKAQGLVADPQRQRSYADGWLGAPEQKVKDLAVELVDIKAFSSDYGPRYYVTFRDHDDHLLLWKTGNNPNASGSWQPGTQLLLSGTVKEHTLWKDTKQTVLLRCKLALDPTRAAGAAA